MLAPDLLPLLHDPTPPILFSFYDSTFSARTIAMVFSVLSTSGHHDGAYRPTIPGTANVACRRRVMSIRCGSFFVVRNECRTRKSTITVTQGGARSIVRAERLLDVVKRPHLERSWV